MIKKSRLKNIINKSKGFAKDPFEQFTLTLPPELDYYKDGSKYRLKEAWKDYGKPNSFKEALWNGLVETIGDKFRMPSIGYNEENDTYEYLNVGRENEIVNRDIIAWDNDVIPLIKELKLGGFIRVFDEETNCWKYKKGGTVESFQEWVKGVNPDYLNDNYDLELAFTKLPREQLDRWKEAVNNGTIDQQNEDGEYINHLPSVIQEGEDYISLKKGREWENPEILPMLEEYWSGKDRLRQSHDLLYENGRYIFKKKLGFFKGGGQMNVIPEGALHARKNHMEGAGEDFTAKGVPVIDKDGNQVAEVEREEITFTKEVTNKLEHWYKKFFEDDNVDKDAIALACGKYITKQILFNTDDRVNLINKLIEEDEL